MKKTFAAVMGVAILGLSTVAFGAAHMKAMEGMVGMWQWKDFTINCTKGGPNGMSCKVAKGPKNVGMEMIQSALAMKDGAFVGKVAHPQTGETYNAKMAPDGPDKFKMDGCTAAGACASGVFTRVK